MSREALARADAVIRKYRPEDYRKCRILIMAICEDYGEWHGDYMDEFKSLLGHNGKKTGRKNNVIGIAVMHLEREGFIEKTGEMRPLLYDTGHARKSPVYRLAP